MRLALLALPVALVACGPDPLAPSDAPLELVVHAPTYGAFLGSEPIEVRGQISDPTASVVIEGQPVKVDGAGRFAVTLPLQGDYEVVDIQAGRRAEPAVRRRIPVFSGRPPSETFPGELPAQLTAAGLERLGMELGAAFDATGWADGLLNALPSTSAGDLQLEPAAVNHAPTRIVLSGVEQGIDVGIAIRDLEIVYSAKGRIFGFEVDVPVTLGYGRVGVVALTQPAIRDDGVVYLRARNTRVDLGEADVSIAGFEIEVVEFLLDGIGFVVEWLGEFLGDVVLDLLGEVEIGGPFDFESDLMGTQLSVALRQVWGDTNGLALGATVGIDEPAPYRALNLPMPVPSTRVTDPVHLVLGVHEGLLDGLLGGAIGPALEQELDLGPFSSIIGTVVGNLPGGDYAPETRRWCVDLAPGPASVVRLREGISPLGALYLPDVDLEIGADLGEGCEPWIIANLAIEARINARGTRLAVELAIGEGGVLFYGAPATAWREDEVVAELSNLVGTLGGALGGALSFDLAELIGGLGGEAFLGDVQPRIVDSQIMLDHDGAPIEGMVAVSMALWPLP